MLLFNFEGACPLRKAKEKTERTLRWGCSSAGRAPALQAGGHGFESHHLHQSVKKNKSRKPVEQYRIEPACSSGG